MSEPFTPAQKSLICFCYDLGLNADDILERMDLSDEYLPSIQAVIDEWLQDCDDTERPFEVGDMEG